MEEIPNKHLKCIKPCKEWDKLPTSTGEFAGFLNHQQYVQNITLSTSFSVAAAWVVLFLLSHAPSIEVWIFQPGEGNSNDSASFNDILS